MAGLRVVLSTLRGHGSAARPRRVAADPCSGHELVTDTEKAYGLHTNLAEVSASVSHRPEKIMGKMEGVAVGFSAPGRGGQGRR